MQIMKNKRTRKYADILKKFLLLHIDAISTNLKKKIRGRKAPENRQYPAEFAPELMGFIAFFKKIRG
jgi:hypothetical protein